MLKYSIRAPGNHPGVMYARHGGMVHDKGTLEGRHEYQRHSQEDRTRQEDHQEVYPRKGASPLNILRK